MIPIAKPDMGENEAQAVAQAVRSGWVTQGPKVAEFEKSFAVAVGAPHAVAVSSCTAALHLALLTMGVGPGDVVAVPSHSFIATANAVRYTGAEPAFVDVSEEDGNLCPFALARFLTRCEHGRSGLFFDPSQPPPEGTAWPASMRAGSRKRRLVGVIAVHQVGFPCRLQDILPLCREHGLFVVEDAACAVGSLADYQGQGNFLPVGAPQADMACFSFHPRKIITCGEGGMITSRDQAVDAALRLARQHGMNVSDAVRHGANKVIIERYEGLGYNYRMTDIQAALGLVQLGRLPSFVAARRRLAARYEKALSGHPWLSAVPEAGWTRVNHQSFRLLLGPSAPLGRDALLQRLLDHGIAAKPGIMNAHQEPAYLPVIGSLPASERWRANSILLPLYSCLDEADQDKIIACLLDFGAL